MKKPNTKGPPRTKPTEGVHPTKPTRATPKFIMAIPPKLRAALEKEATRLHYPSLSSYMLHLLDSHPDRKS